MGSTRPGSGSFPVSSFRFSREVTVTWDGRLATGNSPEPRHRVARLLAVADLEIDAGLVAAGSVSRHADLGPRGYGIPRLHGYPLKPRVESQHPVAVIEDHEIAVLRQPLRVYRPSRVHRPHGRAERDR